MDSSQGVTEQTYRKEKDFIKTLANHFNLSPAGPSGSVVMYASNPYTTASFVGPDFHERVDRAPLLGQPRRIDKALEHAARLLSDRSGRKIVVVLTAGRQADWAKPISEAIKPLRKIDAQTFVVVIGSNPDTRELTPAVDRLKDIFRVASPDDLISRSKTMAKHVREKPGKCSY